MKSASVKTWYDHFGFSASLLCAIHCAIVPILISFSALGSLSFLAHPIVEWFFISIGLVFALLSLRPSYLKVHHKKLPITLAAFGFSLISLSRIEIHELWEAILTPIGAIGITMAHYYNWKLLRDCKHKH